MPKDNEVDEKVVPDSAARELIANMKPATFTAYSREGVGMSVTLCVTAEDHEKIADALKATVAELRAEIEDRRVRHERTERDACMWASRAEAATKRADAAERRVGELEAALRNLVAINEAHNKACEEVMGRPLGWKDDYLNDARKALTGADPT